MMMLPLHFAVYIAEVGCKKSAAANCETVFCAAGKFTEEAKSDKLLQLEVSAPDQEGGARTLQAQVPWRLQR